MNRIEKVINSMHRTMMANIANGKTNKEQVKNVNKELDMDMEEFVKFHELKCIAVLNGTMTLEEGLTIYNLLGEASPERFNGQPTHVKAALTEIFLVLLKGHKAGRSSA